MHIFFTFHIFHITQHRIFFSYTGHTPTVLTVQLKLYSLRMWPALDSKFWRILVQHILKKE